MIEDPYLPIAVAVIISADDCLLIVQKQSSSYYQLPGGKLDGQEQPIEALKRELSEELNLTLADHQIHFAGIHEAKAVNEAGRIVQGHVFIVKLAASQEQVQAHAELREVHWLAKAEIQDYKLANLLREFALPIWLNK